MKCRRVLVRSAFQASAVESATPSITRTDPGYITAKATWLRASGRDGEARALLAAPRSLAKAPTDAEEWLETLLTNARLAASGGDTRNELGRAACRERVCQYG